MLYTNTLYTGREIWSEITKDPTGLLAEEINRRYCTKILEGLYVPNFNLDDKYWLDRYRGDWGFAGIRIGKTKYRLNRETKFYGGRQDMIFGREGDE